MKIGTKFAIHGKFRFYDLMNTFQHIFEHSAFIQIKVNSSKQFTTNPSKCLQYYQPLAASPLASSGFAAIGCFRASPYWGIYILKNYSKLTKKIRKIFFSKIQNFFCLKPSPDQDGTNKKRIFRN